MNLKCETCKKILPAIFTGNKAMTAVKAKENGVIVKNYVLYNGDEDYHYFCSKECENKYKKLNGLL